MRWSLEGGHTKPGTHITQTSTMHSGRQGERSTKTDTNRQRQTTKERERDADIVCFRAVRMNGCVFPFEGCEYLTWESEDGSTKSLPFITSNDLFRRQTDGANLRPARASDFRLLLRIWRQKLTSEKSSLWEEEIREGWGVHALKKKWMGEKMEQLDPLNILSISV